MYGRLRKNIKIVYNSLDIWKEVKTMRKRNSRMIKHYEKQNQYICITIECTAILYRVEIL